MRTLIILLLYMICLVPVDAQVVLQGKITDSAGNMQFILLSIQLSFCVAVFLIWKANILFLLWWQEGIG